jgi:hypothetical protein
MSKKPSVANSPSPPERLVFFVDRSLGRKVVPHALRLAGGDVRVHDDFFAQDALDTLWLAEAGKHGWVVLTKDARIRYRAAEVAALRAAKVRAFVLTAKGDMTGQEIAQAFVLALPAMKRWCAKIAPPFIARVGRDGAVSPFA